MKILFCNYEYPPLGGGGGVVNNLVAEELAKRHDVTVLTSRAFGCPKENIENGVRVLRVPVLLRKEKPVATLTSMGSYVLTAICEGRKLVKREKFDIINTYFSIPTGPVGHSLARAGNLPNIISLMGGDVIDPSKKLSPHKHWYFRALNCFLFRNADAVVAPSDNLIHNMRIHYKSGVEPRKIPFGIRRPVVEPADRNKYGFTQDQVLIACVGRLVPRKQMPQLISLVQALREENIHLIIIGDGPLKQNLLNEASAQGVADKVTLTGFIDETEKFQILKMCDVYASTSQHEGFGLVFLEGMGASLPVVSYNQGGHTDYVINEQNGFVIELNDLDAFIDKTRVLVKDKSLRKKMGTDGYRRAEEYFVDNYAKRYESLYEEVIANHEYDRKS